MLATADHDIEMSNEEFTMIRDFIHEKSGIFFAENKMYQTDGRIGDQEYQRLFLSCEVRHIHERIQYSDGPGHD